MSTPLFQTQRPGAGRLVVVGGDAAGMSAASQARRQAADLEIVVLEQGPHISYAACGMPYLVAGVVDDPLRLQRFTAASARAERGLDVRLGHRVDAIDLEGAAVSGEVLSEGRPFQLAYDRLVIATGASPVMPAVPGVDLTGVFALRQLQHGLDLKRYLDSQRPTRAVIAGAGYVGLDLAAALRVRGLAVTLLKHRASPLLGLEPELSAVVEEALVRHGCVLLREAPLYRLEGNRQGVVEAVRAGGERLPAGVVMLALGISPNSGLAERAGLTVGPAGAIQVDAQGRTSACGVYAAGDCATQRHVVTGEQIFLSQALAANRQGRVAGAHAALDLLGRADEAPAEPGTLGTAIKKVFDVEVAHTGLTLAAARQAGLSAVVAVVTAETRAGYVPGGRPIKVALVAERGTGRLLGGQIVGYAGAAKRIDVLATALGAGLDLDRLASLDLGYAPPLSPLYDPLLVAARQAAKKI